jgi:hypothetical protein
MHLQSSVHFEEVKILFVVCEEFDGPGARVPIITKSAEAKITTPPNDNCV